MGQQHHRNGTTLDGVHPQEGPRDRDAFKARGITFVSPLGFKFVFFAIKGCPRTATLCARATLMIKGWRTQLCSRALGRDVVLENSRERRTPQVFGGSPKRGHDRLLKTKAGENIPPRVVFRVGETSPIVLWINWINLCTEIPCTVSLVCVPGSNFPSLCRYISAPRKVSARHDGGTKKDMVFGNVDVWWGG